VPDLPSALGDIRQRLLRQPDALMLELGAGGELLVAQVRAWLTLAMLSLPLANVLGGGTLDETMIGLSSVVLAILMSQGWLALARQRGRYRWLPWATSTYDVSSTTLVLVMLAVGTPATSLNSIVVWAFYLVSISMTTLRNDGRLTLYTGLLALLQYGILIAVVWLSNPPERLVSVDYGTVTLANQSQRLLLIALMTVIASAVVYRMQRLVDMSGTDGLTGLPNRTWLMHRFPAMLDETHAQGSSLSLCLIDLDYFKRINDDLGHLAGDRALRHVVGVLNEHLEGKECLARLGGEEFTLLLEHPIGHAWERMESMRRAVAARHFAPEHGADSIRLTFSAGIAAWPHDGSDLSALLRRADVRLRQAKRDGRNRVIARDA
jgi:diguanylate cyclase (GGDEF)-like protein